ncbi:MAG: Aminomethyltransferase [Gammaproteobacteria bacterium]|nr:Aminomethyltransferase [Gammaproteobacteria bacterium]
MSTGHFRTPLQHTPFHSRLVAASTCNEWYAWKGYTAPSRLTEVEFEYFAIRNSASIFDITPMTKYRIRGPDCVPYLNRLLTREIGALAVGRVAYCLWCDDAGQLIDDGTLFRLAGQEYRLCSQERHYDWLLTSALGFDVGIEEETGHVAALALQGPTSCAVLRGLGIGAIEMLRPFHLMSTSFQGHEFMISRTGFTGDLGYELWMHPDAAGAIWDALIEAGGDYAIMPIGSEALDVARIEAGFIQANVDFVPADQAVRPGRGRSPLELGLASHVDFRKANFTGRRALSEEQRRGSRYQLVRLDIDGSTPATDSFVYYGRRKVVGHVTSAAWSPTAKANIALASLQTPYGTQGDDLWVEIYYKRELKWERKMARCRVVAGTFYDPPRRRQTPAADY